MRRNLHKTFLEFLRAWGQGCDFQQRTRACELWLALWKTTCSYFGFLLILILWEEVFFKLFALTSVAKRYVCGEKEVTVRGKRKNLHGDEIFVGESESLFYLYPTEHFYSSKQLTSSYCFLKFCYSCDYLGIGLSVICLSSYSWITITEQIRLYSLLLPYYPITSNNPPSGWKNACAKVWAVILN